MNTVEKVNLVNSMQSTLNKIFNLELSEDDNEELVNCFKILIFDDYTFNIICPFLKVFTLREHNITLHINIKTKKERVSDVMAIYLVQPTPENFKIIRSDLESHVFDNFYLNFVEKPEDDEMKTFFSELIKTDYYQRIYKISVHPIGFYIYHTNVFSLNMKDPYVFMNSPNLGEEEVNQSFNNIGKSLFNVLFSLKTIPLIKYKAGWPVDNIVQVIQEQFNYTFDKFPELKEEFTNKNSTVLFLVDRDSDLPIMLHHAASLGSMINDVFGISRVSSKNSELFEIDPVIDFIWNNYLSTDFPTAHGIITEEWKKINEQTKFLDQSGRKNEEVEKISEQISSTLEGLRDLTLKQNILNNHTKFGLKLSDEVKARMLDKIYSIEYDMLCKRKLNNDIKKQFNEMFTISNTNEKFQRDLLRLSLICYLLNPQAEAKELLNNLNLKGSSTEALEYLIEKRNFAFSMKKETPDEKNNVYNFFKQGSTTFLSKFTSLLIAEQPSIIAEMAENVCSKESQEYVTYNLIKKQAEKQSGPFKNIIVFVYGGGSLAEFEYIEQLMLQKDKNVIYGCDYIYSQTEFLKSLEKLSTLK